MGSGRTRRGAVILVVGLCLSTIFVPPASASPVCPDEPRTACGGRIFPEAENSASFIQHDNGEYEAGIKALARDYPRFVKVTKFSDLLGDRATSFEGRDIWLVEITDFNVPEKDKIPVVVSLSVHGTERAGLEGGARYMEDLARWAAEEPDHELTNGTQKDSISPPVKEVLSKVHLYLADINPDGWARGDLQNGGVFQRGNGRGIDLNREFPTMGWTYVPYTALSEPESRSWDRLMHRIDPVITADLHGELTSAQDAFADIMIPAGQWDPKMQAREESLARHMSSNIARYFEKDGVSASTASGVAGMKPAEYATGYDVVGYDASGFMGDYLTQTFGAVDMDVEHFFSHQVPNSTWVAPLEEAHIASVRGEIESMIVEALVTHRIRVSLNLGKAGYFFDPRVVKSKDGYGGPKPPKGYAPEPYRATRMQYFEDLSRYTNRPLRKVTKRSLFGSGLRGLDSLILSDQPLGAEFKESARRRKVAARRIERFVRRGGNLVLTDRAIRLLPRLGVVPRKSIKKQFYGAGHLDIETFQDPYLKGVHHTASQTYYEVPLGFTLDEDASPHVTVRRGAWKKAGGKALAYVEDETRVGLGRMKLGRGTIGIIGALLPQPTERYDHLYGLADHAVTVAGGQILNNMVAFGR